jgi:hypothetical protein
MTLMEFVRGSHDADVEPIVHHSVSLLPKGLPDLPHDPPPHPPLGIMTLADLIMALAGSIMILADSIMALAGSITTLADSTMTLADSITVISSDILRAAGRSSPVSPQPLVLCSS